MKRPLGTTTALAIGAVLILTAPAWSGEKGKMKKDESKETVDMAASARVTIEQAIKTGSEKVAGKVVEAELEKKHDKLIWEVEVVTAENKVIEVHIDALTGEVIDQEEKQGESKQERAKKHK